VIRPRIQVFHKGHHRAGVEIVNLDTYIKRARRINPQISQRWLLAGLASATAEDSMLITAPGQNVQDAWPKMVVWLEVA